MATKKYSSGGFSQMPKMMTDEPSVILKLKKGGMVSRKKVESDHGRMDMMTAAERKKHNAEMEELSEDGDSPKKPSMSERRKAMAAPLLMSKKGGKVGKEEKEIRKVEKELKKHEGMKAGKAHNGLKTGGRAMDAFETKTTVKGNEGKYLKSKMMDGEHHDKNSGTGSIKEGKPAGFKHGGKAMYKATGGSIPSGTGNKANKGRSMMGGTIEGNEDDYMDTEMHGTKRDRMSGTKGIKETNAGGFKKGGMINRTGLSSASIEHDGEFENRAANSTPKGKSNMKTGGVKNANAGGYMMGGEVKKRYAMGGRVNDEGKAMPMPHHFISEPVSNSRQSGTYKKGGRIKKMADGGMMDDMTPERKNKGSETAAMKRLLGMPLLAKKRGGGTNC
jgi:hypothetical protein